MASGKVQTVLGPIDPSKLGCTLTHEHLVMDYQSCYFPPTRETDLSTVNQHEITLRNRNWVQENCYSHHYNLSMGDEPIEDIINEAIEFKKEGGSTIVEVSLHGINRDVEKLKKISKATGLNIVSGTGFYLDHSISDDMKALSVEEMSNVRHCSCMFKLVILNHWLIILSIKQSFALIYIIVTHLLIMHLLTT